MAFSASGPENVGPSLPACQSAAASCLHPAAVLGARRLPLGGRLRPCLDVLVPVLASFPQRLWGHSLSHVFARVTPVDTPGHLAKSHSCLPRTRSD